MRRLTWAHVLARRQARTGVSAPVAAAPAGAVAAMCGAHAQVLSAAELSVGLRLDGATRADVRAALWDDGSLVKTFGPRGTVHLLPTAELPIWTGALGGLDFRASRFPEGVRVDAAQRDELVAAIGAALAEAGPLTVDELGAAVVARVGAWAGAEVMPAFGGFWPRWRQVVDEAANRGLLCFGPDRGRKVTYTDPRRLLPGLAPAQAGAALAELARRWLRAYGPATPADLARWLGATPAWGGRLFERLGGELARVEVEGWAAWALADDLEAPAAAPPEGIRLLPYFDAYTVASQPREVLFPGPIGTRTLAGGQAGNFPVLLLDGKVAGLWHQRRSGRRLAVTVEPLVPLGAAQRRALEAEVERVGKILEAAAALTVGPVTTGPHA